MDVYEEFARSPHSGIRPGPCAELKPETKAVLEEHKYIPLPFGTKDRDADSFQEKMATAIFRVSDALSLLLWGSTRLILHYLTSRA
jgi:hypothetical protein